MQWGGDTCQCVREEKMAGMLRAVLASEGAVDGGCRDQNFVGGRFDCVDYNAGAYKLAGKTLSMTLDLSSAECGCNAAVYLVGMPQLDKRGDCDGCAQHPYNS